MNTQRDVPNWEQLYQERDVESLPWFNPKLDPDLEQALNQLNLKTGTVLDLGTGPGTQAIALRERNFKVTATDISPTAVFLAQEKAQQKGLEISFVVDDILNSRLGQEFDFVFDRGCFHIFSPEQRQNYVEVLARLIKPGGYLFLKCFSYKETMDENGPYRYTPKEVEKIFHNQFQLKAICNGVFHGNLKPPPQALFCSLQKS